MLVPHKFKIGLNRIIDTFLHKNFKGYQPINKKCRILNSRNNLSQPYNKGGMKTLHLDSEIQAFATRWINRLMDGSNPPWKDYIWYKFEKAVTNTNLDGYPTHFIFYHQSYHQLSKKQITSVSKNIKGIFGLAFETWHKIKPQNMKPIDQYTKYEILNQIVYLNPMIQHNNKTIPIHLEYSKEWVTINDLWDDTCETYPGGDILPDYKLQALTNQHNITGARNFIRILSQSIPQEWLNILRQDIPCRFAAPLVLKTYEHIYLIKEIKNSRFTCHYGVLDPHIQAVYPKSHSTITLSIEDINEAINGLHYASPDHNKIYPYFVKILGPVVSSFNDLNLGWQPEKDKEHVTPHSVSVKVLYRELIATLTTKPLKSKAWEECLQGIPPIDPKKALVASFKSKIFSNQTKANVYKILMKNIWFGEKCKSLNSISHLQWCNACHPKCKCATCDLHNYKCVCHVDPTARNFN